MWWPKSSAVVFNPIPVSPLSCISISETITSNFSSRKNGYYDGFCFSIGVNWPWAIILSTVSGREKSRRMLFTKCYGEAESTAHLRNWGLWVTVLIEAGGNASQGPVTYSQMRLPHLFFHVLIHSFIHETLFKCILYGRCIMHRPVESKKNKPSSRLVRVPNTPFLSLYNLQK